MPAPITPLVSPIIAAAMKHAQERLDEAKAKNRDEVARLVAYLHAVAETIKGLEAEADQLLSECRWMDWRDDDQRQMFLSRCGRYLDVDVLRLHLSSALEGLDVSRRALRKRAESRRQRSAKRILREGVLDAVDSTVTNYKQYLAALALGPKTSGVAGFELNWLRDLIAEATTPEQAQAAKEAALPTIEATNENRIGYEALGAIEALGVRVQDAFS